MEAPPVIPKPRPKKRGKVIAFTVIGVLLAVAVIGVLLKERTPPIEVQTTKVMRHSLTNVVVANGQIQPVVQVTISPEVSGQIIDLPVKEGELVTNGQLLVIINPDTYIAAVNQANASLASSVAGEAQAAANVEKAEADYQRNQQLYNSKLLAASDFITFKVARDVARAQLESATNQVDMAQASLDTAKEELAKTTITSPLDGTITTLNSQQGERVLGTVQNEGTIIMIISDLNQIEARVDVGEMDVVGIKPGQQTRLDVDAFKDRKFTGVVTAVADSAVGSGTSSGSSTSSSSGSSSQQQATQFEVRIRVNEKEPAFRPGMSVTADIETEYHTNVLTVPLASVTTRPMKPVVKADPPAPAGTNTAASTAGTNTAKAAETKPVARPSDATRPTDVVFVVEGDHVRAVPVKIGICDDSYWEISDGLTNDEEVISGGYRAINRDLQDGSRIHVGPVSADMGAGGR